MRALITGGGTGGHINPALAIASIIKEHDPEAVFLYAGTPFGMEAKLVPQAGYEFAPIKVKGFQRRLSFENIKKNIQAAAYLASSAPRANEIIKKFKPDIVIGTGGYVSGPVVRQAAKKGIPTVIHEQNAFPGVTTRILSRSVDKVMLTVTPNSGYKLDKVTAMNTTSNEDVSVTNNSTFAMPAGNVNVVATFVKTNEDVYTVTVLSSANGTVLVNTKSCPAGQKIYLTAIPSEGYDLLCYKVMKASSNESVLVTDGAFTMPDSNVSVYATFAKKTYSVTANTDVNGSVSFNPGIYAAGATVTPISNPADGYMLDTLTVVEKGTDAVVPVSNNTFVMPACDVTVTPTFKKAEYKITGVNSAYGTITTNPTTAEMGDSVTIVKKPATGYALEESSLTVVKTVDGATVPVENGTFTMPASDVKITATFEQEYYQIEIPASAHGTVTCDLEEAAYNETITLKVTPEKGYEKKTLTVGYGDNKNVPMNGYSFKMPAANVKVTATFDTIGYDVQVEKATGGTVVPSKTNAHVDETVELNFVPQTDYQFEKYVVTDANGKEIKDISDNSFTMPASNVTVTASFKKITYGVNVAEVDGGTVMSNKATAAYGDAVTLTATASTGYKLDKLVITNDADGKEIKHTNGTFTMPRSSVTVTAFFVQKDYTITLSDSNAEAKVGTAVVTKAHCGDTVAIVAKAGKTLNTVLVTKTNGEQVFVNMNTNTFTMPDSAVQVTITYK